MATVEELYEGIRRAGAAGDANAVRVLGTELARMQAPAEPAQPVQELAQGMSSGVPVGASQTIQSGPSTDFGVGQRQESPVAAVTEAFTGAQRATEASKFFPDWRANLPEFSLTKGDGAVKAIKVAAATMTASPEETAKIVKSQYPDVSVLQDDKGNYFFESGIDKKVYAIPPGFGVSDIPRAVVAGAMFAPAAGAATVAGRVIGTGLTQAAIETGQAAMGGEFNAADIPFAAATQGLFETVAARNAIKQTVGELLGGLLQKERSAMPAEFAVPGMVSSEIANVRRAPIVSAEALAREAGGALDAEARTARLGQYISPTGELTTVPPASLAREGMGALDAEARALQPQQFISPTGERTAAMPVGMQAEMGGALDAEARAARLGQYISPTGERTAQVPANIQAEMSGALSRERAAAPATQPESAVQPAAAVAAQPAPAPAPVAAPGTQLTAGERFRAGIMDEAELGELLRKASSNEIGSTKAKEELATLIGENPEKRAVFERLGIEPLIDWLSDNQQVRAGIGLTRSKVGSAAESEYLQTLIPATKRVDALMASIDGSKDISLVSESVKRKMVSTRQSLAQDATKIYNEVNKKVPQTTKVELGNTKSLLDKVKANLGGKEASLHKEERRLASIISAKDVSYGVLKREKDLVFKALQKQESPYGSMVESDLKELYSALSKDQIENVSRVAGAEEGMKLRGANFLWAKNRAMGERITSIFGKDEAGSIAALMKNAIQTGSKGGDIAALNKLLKLIPKEDAALRRSVVSTAINDLALSKTGNNRGNISFQKFADTWDGIRRNSEVLRIVSREIGPEATSMLQDFSVAAEIIAESQTNVKHTGKANQILSDALNAEGFFTKALSTTAGKATTAMGGALFGGPVGAGAGVAIQNLISKGSKEGVKRLGDLLSDPAFKALIREMAKTGEVSTRARNRLNISRAYNRLREYMPKRINPQQESK